MTTPDFYQLTVFKTESLIDGQARSVYFEVLQSLQEVFMWYPGQHLTLRFEINGEEHRRSYSISSSPYADDNLRITVKRVVKGLISNHINDHVKVGDVIEVMPPFGGFQLVPDQQSRRTHYFFGAGSGITPLFAMLRSVLYAEPHSQAHLIYGNLNDKTIIFKQVLQQLLETYPQQLTVSHVLSKPSMWSSFKYWKKGIIDADAITQFIQQQPPYAQDAQYYICGPGGMNQAVKKALMQLDVPTDRIHMESYGGKVEIDDTIQGISATAEIELNGKKNSVPMQSNQTILAASRKAGLNPPFSCQSGVCGACRATLKEGQVHMRAHMALEDKEIKSGVVLTCQSVAITEQLALSYD